MKMLSNVKMKLAGILETSLLYILSPFSGFIIGRLHVYQEIARNVQITEQWTEFKSERPMKVKRRLQEISLAIKNCRQHVRKSELQLTDGTVIRPEVKIIDEFGATYILHSGRYGVHDYDVETGMLTVSSAGYSGPLPQDRSYVAVLVRSDKPFRCSKIFWHNYNLK